MAKAYYLYHLGKPYHGEAYRELKRIENLKPDVASKHSALAFLLYERGDLEEAKKEVLKAVRLDPADLGSRYVGKKMGMKLKPPKGSPH